LIDARPKIRKVTQTLRIASIPLELFCEEVGDGFVGVIVIFERSIFRSKEECKETKREREGRTRGALNYEYFIGGNHPRAILRFESDPTIRTLRRRILFPVPASFFSILFPISVHASFKVERAKWLARFDIGGYRGIIDERGESL